MRIGIDIDDTMSRNWAFFRFLAAAFLDGGHEVFVVTFREDSDQTARELEARGVRCSRLICASPEALSTQGWAAWKGAVCQREGIEIFFDDMEEVINHLPSQTVGLMVTDPQRGLIYYD